MTAEAAEGFSILEIGKEKERGGVRSMKGEGMAWHGEEGYKFRT